MLFDYVQASNDRSILTRALPLAEREFVFWATNRTLNVTSPFTNKTYQVSRYAVNNTGPRPESYLTDYSTANGPDISLNETQKEALYAELASGAETGWDYTVRFASQPFAGGTNNTNPILRTLAIRETIPICLNSILCRFTSLKILDLMHLINGESDKAHVLLASLYSEPFSTSTNTTAKERAAFHTGAADQLKSAILDLFWDSNKLAFYDFNTTSMTRNSIFTTAHFYPMWNGIFPDELLSNETAAFGAFSSINMVMNKFNGTFPTTFIESGLQWDAPNAWPPHQFIALQALQNIPMNISTKPVPATPSGQTAFSLIPSGQLGLSETQLPGQPIKGGSNASATVDTSAMNGTVVNGGNATANEPWSVTLQREMANRYFTSALCSWHATGGSIPNILPRLSDAELGITNSANNTGNMFEKFSYSDVDSSGGGGEYTVQAGFGWTNGIVLWVASNYGNVLNTPQCPPLLVSTGNSSNSGSGGGGGSNGTSAGYRDAPVPLAIFVYPIIVGTLVAVVGL